VLGAFALYPGERFGQDLFPEERRSQDGRLGAIRLNPDETPSEELIQLLLESMAQAQLRAKSAQAGVTPAEEIEETREIGHNGMEASTPPHRHPMDAE
jgi:hypothetical protein